MKRDLDSVVKIIDGLIEAGISINGCFLKQGMTGWLGEEPRTVLTDVSYGCPGLFEISFEQPYAMIGLDSSKIYVSGKVTLNEELFPFTKEKALSELQKTHDLLIKEHLHEFKSTLSPLYIKEK